MTKRSVLVAMVLTVALSVPAVAQEGQEAKPAKEKLICKSETITGSRLKKKRTCMTAAQWEAQSAGAQQGVNDFVRESNNYAPNSNPNPGGG